MLCCISQCSWEGAVAVPTLTAPACPTTPRAAQRGSLHPPAAPGATFHFPAHPTQDLPIPLHSLKLCSPGSQLQQNSSLLSLEPRVWWLDNKTFVVFLKQVVHIQPEPFSQHLSLQTKLQRQAFSFLVSFFYYYFLLFLFFFLEEKFGDGSWRREKYNPGLLF